MTPRKLHQLIGTINFSLLGYSKSKSWKNQPFYLLTIHCESPFFESRDIDIYAFANLVTPTLWTTLQQKHHEGKKYRFWCEKRTRGWRLSKMEEIET